MISTPRVARHVERRLLERHAGTDHDRDRPRRASRIVTAQFQRDAHVAQRLGLRRTTAALSVSVTRAPSPHEQLGRGHAAARRSHHHDAPPDDREVIGSHTHHRSFSVVRLNNAKRIDTIRKRAMTLGSLHPISSK